MPHPVFKLCNKPTNAHQTVYTLSYIIHRYVSVASATIIKLSYKDANNIQMIAQNVYIKPPDITILTITLGDINYTFCAIICIMILLLYDILMMIAGATETYR